MALLRNLEQSLSGLLEGTVGRVFRTEVRPTEIARKLAREMEINKRVSLSRTYAPTDYLVYLSPDDRARYAGVEGSIAEELGAYLLEHARRERLVLVRRPLVEFRTDQRLRLGEFGIEARTAPISAAEAPPRGVQPTADVDQPSRRDPAPDLEPAPAPRGDDRRGPDDALGSTPAAPGFEPPSAVGRVDDAPYEDPYAGDPFGGDGPSEDPYGPSYTEEDSAEYAWEDAPRSQRATEPDPALDPAPSEREPASAAASEDWLDPVDDWAPAAPASPAADQRQFEPASAPQQPEHLRPHAPRPPAAQPPAGVPGAPWIDPTLRRPERPQFAPPIVPARPAPAAPSEPAQTQAAPDPAPAPPAQPRRPEPQAPQTTLLVDGTAHELTGDRVILGRSRSADIVISDPSVSRQHLELRRDDRGWYAVDLGSTNGSELSGERITEPRRLEPGQRLTLGHADAIIEVR